MKMLFSFNISVSLGYVAISHGHTYFYDAKFIQTETYSKWKQ